MNGEWLAIGRVRSVNPQRRELRMDALPAQHRQFTDRQWLWFAARGQSPLRCRLAALEEQSEAWLATLTPGASRDTVAALRSAEVLIPLSEQHPRLPGEWYASELPGMAMADAELGVVGTVIEAWDTPAHPVARVRHAEGSVRVMPLPEALVETVDVDARIVRVCEFALHALEEAPNGDAL